MRAEEWQKVHLVGVIDSAEAALAPVQNVESPFRFFRRTSSL